LPELGVSWDVIVVDGESIESDAQRADVLRRIREYPHCFATTLYVCNRLPSRLEAEQALAGADDVVCQGWELGDRVRRRVQSVALAPWRRAAALRLEAERLGDQRLRVVRPAPDAGRAPTVGGGPEQSTGTIRRLDRALPFVLLDHASRLGDAARELVVDAFYEGRRVGVAAVHESAEQLCLRLVDELAQGRPALRPEDVEDIEATFRAEPGSPIVAARFGGAEAGITAVREELRFLANAALAAIDRRDARPASEP
jgi:hypothetical protein